MNLKAFEYYLESKKHAASTIADHIMNLQRFKAWAAEALPEAEQASYNELLGYVQWLKSRELTTPTINLRLNSLRKYYEHLKEEEVISKNPVRNLRIRGSLIRVTEQPLSYIELEDLYNNYVSYSKEKDYHIRNTAMLGLMIWQGVNSGDLLRMEPRHVRLGAGNVYIPSSRRGNSRELRLDARQIIILHQHMESLPLTSTKLFIGSVRNHVTKLSEEVKGINGIVRNMLHIRASVILYWMKLHEKRQVQYMAGHKWISTTEMYEQQEITSLSDQLNRHHPFG